MKIPNPVTKEWLEEMYAKGMVAKKDLVDGVTYKGSCRNATEARWNAELNCFIYQRYKFGSVYDDTCNHPEDDDGFDLFVPMEEIDETV